MPKVLRFLKWLGRLFKKLWKGYISLMRKLGKKLREKDWSKVKAKLSDMGRKNAIATGFSGGGSGFSSPFLDSITGGNTQRRTILTQPTGQKKKKRRKKKRSRGRQIIINV